MSITPTKQTIFNFDDEKNLHLIQEI